MRFDLFLCFSRINITYYNDDEFKGEQGKRSSKVVNTTAGQQ